MATGRTNLLDLPLPVEGELDGTWGDMVNYGLTEYLDIAIAGRTPLTSANFTAGALTLSLTEGDTVATNIVASSAQYATLYTSSLATNSTITAPSSNRAYRVINADSTYTLTVKASGQTGITFQPGQSGIVAFNGTDYALVGTIGPTVPAANGGTGQTSYAVGDLLYASTSTALSKLADVATGNALISGGVGVAPSYGKIGLTTHVSGTLPVANGGTGVATTTAYGLIAAGTTSTGNFQQVSGTGNSGQLLTSNGAGALPTWQDAPASGVSKGQSIAFAMIFGL